MAKKKPRNEKTKKNGEPKQREKDNINLAKLGVVVKSETISQFVKTNLKEIKKNSARRIIDDVLIPFSLLTSRITADGVPIGRSVRVRKSRVYEILAEDIRSLIDAGVYIYDPERDDEVLLLFLLNDLINSGGKKRVETEQAQKQEEKEKKEVEIEERKKKRTEEIAKKKKESEETRKGEEKAANEAEQLQREATLNLQREAEAKAHELQELQREVVKKSNNISDEILKPVSTEGERIKIKIIKKIEKGSEKSLNDVSKRDEKQDEIDIKDGGLSQVPQEQPITQAQENADLQEVQLEENVNNEAVVIAQTALFVQEDDNERQEVQQEQIEPVGEQSDNVVLDFFENQENKTAELLSGDDTTSTVEIKEGDYTEYWAALDSYKNNLLILRDLLDNQENTDAVIADILSDRDEIFEGEDRIERVMLKNIRELTANIEEGKDVRPVLVRIAEKTRSLLNQRQGQLRDVIEIAESKRRRVRFQEEEKELRVFLAKTQYAIDTIKEQLLNDGLVIREINPPTSEGSNLIIESLNEMSQEIKINNVTNDLLERFVRLYRIVSIDTQDVITQALQNSVLEGDILGVGTRTLNGALLRFMGRLLYNNVNDAENENAIEAFVESGDRLEGRDEGVVSSLIRLLKIVVPEPPEITIEPVEMKRQRTPEAERQTMKRRKRYSGVLERDVRRGFSAIRDVGIGGLFSYVTDRARNVLSSRQEEKEREVKLPEVEFSSEDEKDVVIEFEADLESGAVAAALGAVANADVELGLNQFVKSFDNSILSSIASHPFEPEVVRDIVSRQPGFLSGLANSIGSRVAPIFARSRNYRGISKAELAGAIVAGLLAMLVKEFIDEGEEPQQETREIQREVTTEAKRGSTTEFFKGEEKQVPVEDIDKPAGEPLLRPDFFNLGTDYFDKIYNTPIKVQNSEWAEFDFVPIVDRQNIIELDNIYGESIRFSGDMYYPEYQAPVAPPSRRAIIRTRDTLTPAIQLSQGYARKFDGAVTPYDNLSYVMNRDEFNRSWEDVLLYHPDNSIQ